MYYSNRRGPRLTSSIFRTQPETTPETTPKKRTREVYDNAQLAHVWASGNVPRGRSSSMFFEDGIIYSYGRHFPIAKIHTNNRGEQLALITTDRRSNSTNRHIGHTAQAVTHLASIRVVDINPTTPEAHQANIDALLNEIDETVKDIFKLRGWSNAQRVMDVADKINVYCAHFKVKGAIDVESEGFIMTLEALEEAILIRGQEREARNKAREATEQRKIDNLRVEHFDEIRKLNLAVPRAFEEWKSGEISGYEFNGKTKFVLRIPGAFGHTKRINLYPDQHVINEYLPKIEAVIKERSADAIEAWRRGGPWFTRFYGGGNSICIFDRLIQETGRYDIIRVNGNVIETSQRAEVPLDHGIRLMRKLIDRQARQGERVGHYALSSVDCDTEDCIVKIGCHTFSMKDCYEVLKPYMSQTEEK